MRFLRFLSFEKPYLFIHAISFFTVAFIFLMDPYTDWEWKTFFYALFLNLLILCGFLLYRYYQNIQAVKNRHNEDHVSVSLEGYELQKYMEEMERMHIQHLNEVQEKQNEHYDFIVSWFHEIKTPISVLRLMSQTEIDPKSFREEVEKIEHYVDQALYYAKLDNFSQDYEIKNCHVERIIKELVKGHSKTFISKKIRIQLALQPMAVQTDPKWLQFILNQLMTNSLKYTEENGEISISTKETSEEKQLIIRDNGIGIESKDLPRIFNRGFTGNNGRLYTKSTGMGLYLAQELSNKLGHYITCQSEVNSYTEFIIHFPTNYDPYLHNRNHNHEKINHQ